MDIGAFFPDSKNLAEMQSLIGGIANGTYDRSTALHKFTLLRRDKLTGDEANRLSGLVYAALDRSESTGNRFVRGAK